MTNHLRISALAVVATSLVSFGIDARAKDDTPRFAFKDQAGDYLDVLQAGRPLARYVCRHDDSTAANRLETYKPFLHVFGADGKTLITKGAGGLFTHHRGVFIGWNKINVNGKQYDRWHMKGGDQIHEKFSAQNADQNRASFTSFVRWTGDSADTSLIEEERTFTFSAAPTPAYAFIDTTSKLKAVAGPVLLDGDPEHAGLHFRPADEVDRKATNYLYPKTDAAPHKDLDYPWVAETFVVNGQRYSVVYLNHPSNPKGARCSAYRDYGRFGMFWRTNIEAKATREFRVRFILIAGDMPSAEFIQRAWNEYAGATEPIPPTTAKAAERGK